MKYPIQSNTCNTWEISKHFTYDDSWLFNLKNVVLTHMDEFAIGKKQPNIVFILIIFGFKIGPSYLWLSIDLGTGAWNQKKCIYH